MKVIHLISGGDVGGAKTHVLSLLHGLSKTEHIRLVCFVEGQFAREARELGIDTVVYSQKNIMKIINILVKMIKEEKFQILHCHGSRANLMGILLRAWVKVPIVTTVHSDYRLDYLGRPWQRITYGTINTYCVRRIRNHICVSDSMADMLICRGFNAQNIFTLYNGVDVHKTTLPVNRSEYFRKYGLDVGSEDVVFGIAARLSAVKDIATLIRAFAQAQMSCPNIRLLIAGDGELRDELEQMALEYCSFGSVAFAGWINNTDDFYQAIDINMLTSLSEGFPYALPEGGRMSCATISSRVGGVPALIEHGVTGLLFEAGDVKTLTDQMVKLASDKELRLHLGNALFEKTSKEFSLEAMVKKQMDIYRVLLRRFKRSVGSRDGVLICGAYGKGNAGDDSILEAVLNQLRDIDPDMPIHVLSRNPKETSCRYRVRAVHTFHFLRFIARMKKTKLYISGGGSLIQDATSTRSLRYYLANISLAKRCGNEVLMYGCGIGPVNNRRNRKKAGRVIDRNVDLITLREEGSVEELRTMGVFTPPIRVTADPALLIEPEKSSSVSRYMSEQGLDPFGRYAMFVLRPWKGFEDKASVFAQTAQKLYDQHGLTPVFLALEPGKDMRCSQSVSAMVDCPSFVLPAPQDGHMIVGLMGRMQVVVSMRLHALIFGSGQGIPLVGVVYDPKVSGFLDYLGQKHYVSLEDVSLDEMFALVESAIEAGCDRKSAERLRKLAEKNQDAARELLK